MPLYFIDDVTIQEVTSLWSENNSTHTFCAEYVCLKMFIFFKESVCLYFKQWFTNDVII